MNEQSLVTRVNRLERENRRMKLAGMLMLVGVAAVIVMGQAKATKVAKVIEAERFVLRDENGRERAVLETLLDHTDFTLRNSDDTVTSSLFASDRLAGVEIERQNESIVQLSSAPESAGLRIFDRNKKTRAGIGIQGKDGTPVIVIQDKNDNLLIMLTDKEGMGLMSFFRHGDKPSGVVFLESDGSKRIQLFSNKDDPRISFYDKYGTKRAALGLYKGTPVITFANEQGKSVWGKTGNR